MSDWVSFEQAQPEWGKYLYLLYEYEDWYDGPLLAAEVVGAVRIEDGRYVAVRSNNEHWLIEDVTLVSWRYIPESLTHPRLDQELAAALAKFVVQAAT